MEKSPLIYPFAYKERRKKFFYFFVALLLLAALGFVFFRLYELDKNPRGGRPGLGASKDNAPASESVLENFRNVKEAVSLAPSFLGYDRIKTYLVLFLNNTEIRPGGGFIGSYALIRADKGKIELLETSGSENLDWAAPPDFKIKPPYPIAVYMKQDFWYFRDSNWSPDFPTSARFAQWFYRFEGGREGSKIDGVIGITPTVVEKIMEMTGPIYVGGKKFEAENFTEELEYHVEFGYKEAGEPVEERKRIIGDLTKEFFNKFVSLPPWKWVEAWSNAQALLKEKQIMIFSNDTDLQDILARNNWAGLVKNTDSDFLMVTDSNLASLKTDPSVQRHIIYQVRPFGDDFLARVTIDYDHQGNFDWRTTRYRTYAKIYAPEGSRLVKADGFIDATKKSAAPDNGLELNKVFWGGFLSVEPQTKKTLTLEYVLPPRVGKQIKNGLYTLFVQKQLGTIAHRLTVDLDFGKTNGAGGRIFEEINLRIDRGFRQE